ncbi:hypothetical protein SAMN05443244_3225 [Terriglobus roseus]|uniref:Uncharacterized protein n=1 Tax=Terriglobus roseus TaxID=392734 RepID=A0A1H4RQQ6_9BACT|nr:hypothetical protein SAMN05443244_3225 [Terriglobus roseus]
MDLIEIPDALRFAFQLQLELGKSRSPVAPVSVELAELVFGEVEGDLRILLLPDADVFALELEELSHLGGFLFTAFGELLFRFVGVLLGALGQMWE